MKKLFAYTLLLPFSVNMFASNLKESSIKKLQELTDKTDSFSANYAAYVQEEKNLIKMVIESPDDEKFKGCFITAANQTLATKNSVPPLILAAQHTASNFNGKNYLGQTELMVAAAQGDTGRVNSLANPNTASETDSEGNTPLIYAVISGDLNTVRAILNLGRINQLALNNNDQSALTLAYLLNNQQIVQLILGTMGDQVVIDQLNELLDAARNAISNKEHVRLQNIKLNIDFLYNNNINNTNLHDQIEKAINSKLWERFQTHSWENLYRLAGKN